MPDTKVIGQDSAKVITVNAGEPTPVGQIEQNRDESEKKPE